MEVGEGKKWKWKGEEDERELKEVEVVGRGYRSGCGRDGGVSGSGREVEEYLSAKW